MYRMFFKKILSNNVAATSIEYALIAALVSVTIIAGATAIGTKLNTTYSSVSSNL